VQLGGDGRAASSAMACSSATAACCSAMAACSSAATACNSVATACSSAALHARSPSVCSPDLQLFACTSFPCSTWHIRFLSGSGLPQLQALSLQLLLRIFVSGRCVEIIPYSRWLVKSLTVNSCAVDVSNQNGILVQ
jgi:hypothetical protein